MYEVRYFVRGSQRSQLEFPENTTLTTRNEEIDIAGELIEAANIILLMISKKTYKKDRNLLPMTKKYFFNHKKFIYLSI